MQKRCSECERTHDLQQLVCPCGEVLETRNYLRWIWITGLLALVTVGGLWAVGALRHFSIVEVFIMEAAFLVVLYPVSKWIEGRRQPGRPVNAEMGSVFSGRYDRGLVTGALVLIFVVWVLPGSSGQGDLDPGYAPIRMGWLYTASVLWLVAMGAMIRDQGLAFFDPRIKNTYVHGGRERA